MLRGIGEQQFHRQGDNGRCISGKKEERKNEERKLKMKDLKEEKSSNTFNGSLGVEGWINILLFTE